MDMTLSSSEIISVKTNTKTVSLLLIPRVFLTIMVHDKFSEPGPDCHDSEHYKVHKSHRQLYSDTSRNIRSQIIHFLG